MRIKGRVEVFTPSVVSGWLSVFGKPEDVIRLELLLDGVPIEVATADGFRADVAARGFGDGACEFRFKLAEPLTAAEAKQLQLRVVGSDIILELPRDGSELNALLTADANAHRAVPRKDGRLKVFIVGSPRSGTSVLLRGIQAVFGLRAHGESHVIPGVAQAIYHLRSYFRRFRDEEADLLIRQLPMDRIEEPLLQSIRAFYREAYEGEGWVDKTPSDEAVHSAPLIRRLFPDAKLIVTRRSGVEVVDSYRRKFKVPFREACENWVRVMEGIALIREQCADILEIDQFDMANDPAGVGLRVSAYLGDARLGGGLGQFLAEDWEDRMSTHDWGARLRMSDVEWTEMEAGEFAEICGGKMASFGYKFG